MTDQVKLYCVVPLYNEAVWLPRLLAALQQQTVDIRYVFVDNASTDGSVEIIQQHRGDLQLTVITEAQKGTGAASETGFRYALEQGATHVARCDADCAPSRDWAERLYARAQTNQQLVLGQVQCTDSDPQYRFYDGFMFQVVRVVSTAYGRCIWRGPQYKAPFYYGVGNNFMVTAAIYQQVSGFERTAIDDADEDGVLFDKIRRSTDHVAYDNLLHANPSLRRIRRYGYVRTMLHYWGRKYRAPVIDVR